MLGKPRFLAEPIDIVWHPSGMTGSTIKARSSEAGSGAPVERLKGADARASLRGPSRCAGSGAACRSCLLTSGETFLWRDRLHQLLLKQSSESSEAGRVGRRE
jgi:hypothetical protein